MYFGWHFDISNLGTRCTFKLSWKTSLRDISLGDKYATNASRSPKVERWRHTEKKKRWHFQESWWCFRVTQFYKHIPSLCMTSQAFSVSLPASHTDPRCQNVIPDQNIVFAGWGSFHHCTAFHLHIQICLSHQVSLARTEYISCRLLFDSSHIMHNNYLIMSCVMSMCKQKLSWIIFLG